MPKKKRKQIKVKPPPLVRSSNSPFKLTLQEMNAIPLDKYVQKTVVIKYWQEFPDIFEGQISCISSKMQIRLQHMNALYINESLLPKNFHHAYWFHFKNIKSIYHHNKDITTDIMDIMKYRMMQSFLFYCAENVIYRKSTQYIEYLENDNVIKILTQLTKNPSNYQLYLECHIPNIFEMAIKHSSAHSAENIKDRQFRDHTESFLYDMNRSNSHLLLKRVFKNKQRIAACFEINEMLRMLDQYEHLVIEYVKQLYGIDNVNIKKYTKHVQRDFFTEKKTHDPDAYDDQEKHDNDNDKSSWSTYIDWDSEDVNQTVRNWKLYKPDGSCSKLYRTSCWSNEPTTPPPTPKKRYRRLRIKKLRRCAKNEGLDNKYKSQWLQKSFKNRHTNPMHHGKNFHRAKKLKKKRNRINTKKEIILISNECRKNTY